MTTAMVTPAPPVAKSIPQLSPLELAALKVAGRELDHVRQQLTPGKYAVALTVQLSGGLTVRPDQEHVALPGDNEALLAWCYSNLSRRAQHRLRMEIARHGDPPVTGADRQQAKELVKLIRRLGSRTGAISGAVVVQVLERHSAEQDRHQQDDQQDEHEAGGTGSPRTAVGPGRQRRKQQHDQQYQQDR